MGAITPSPRALAAIEWGVATQALDVESGDLPVVVAHAGGVLLAAIDGLGHGAKAAAASRAAAAVLQEHAGQSIDALVQRCHEALHGTRGAAMTLVALDTRNATLTWAGVGNVEAVLLHADPAAVPARKAIGLRGGVVGYQLPTLHTTVHPVAPGDTVVLATDGVRSAFISELSRLRGSPDEMANDVLQRHGKGTDDALVLVARYLGPSV